MGFKLNAEMRCVAHQDFDDDTPFILSVFCWTYNDVSYIKKSIDSILMQKTNFNIEVIIHDDASTDGTQEVIKEYENKYPRIFRNILQAENQYSKGVDVTKFIFNYPKGKYIALIHGDDYWVDPYKLQKQVDFMESNPDYVMCFTRYQRYFEDTEVFQISGHNESKTYNLKDFMHANHAATATVMFRSLNFDLKYLNNSPFGDWVLYNLILKYGDAYYMNDVTAVYRRHYFNSDFYNPMPYKKKLYILNRLFLRIHGVKYFPIFIKQVIKLFVFNKLY